MELTMSANAEQTKQDIEELSRLNPDYLSSDQTGNAAL